MISSWLSAKLGVGTGAGRVRMTKRGWMCISGLGYGAVCLSMGLHPALWAVLVLWFIWGMFYGPEEVLGQVLFADAIDEHMRGRVYSFMGVVFSLAGMVGYLITGWAVPAFGAINTIVTGGALFIIATVFTFILYRLRERYGRRNRGMRQRAVRVHDCALYIASGHHRLTSATLRATLITPRAGDFYRACRKNTTCSTKNHLLAP